MGIPYHGPDPTDPRDLIPKGWAESQFATIASVGGGAPVTRIRQSGANTTPTSAAVTALTTGFATETGQGHSVSGGSITLPAGTYLFTCGIEFNIAATRTPVNIGVRIAGGSGTFDLLEASAIPAAKVQQVTFFFTLVEECTITPLVQVTSSTTANRTVVLGANTYVRVMALTNLPAGPPPNIPVELQEKLNLFEVWQRNAKSIGGGGLRGASLAGITWSQPFYTGGGGKNNYHVANVYEISMPVNGTSVQGVGGAGNRSVSGGYLPLGAGESLYYIPPYVSASGTSVAANFRVVGMTSQFFVPEEWILVAQRSNNTTFLSGNAYEVTWGDFERSIPWQQNSSLLRAGAAGAGGNVVLGTGSSQVIMHRIIDGWYESHFTFIWGSSATSPGGSLCFAVPVAPTSGAQWNRSASGLGRIYINRSPVADYPLWPEVIRGEQWLYFRAPYDLANIRMARAQIWNGSDGSGATAIPKYANTSGAIDVAGTTIEGEIRYMVTPVAL